MSTKGCTLYLGHRKITEIFINFFWSKNGPATSTWLLQWLFWSNPLWKFEERHLLRSGAVLAGNKVRQWHSQMLDREKWQTIFPPHHPVLKKTLLLENLAKALPRYFPATLSIILLHCICLSPPSYKSKSILGRLQLGSYTSFARAYNCGRGL